MVHYIREKSMWKIAHPTHPAPTLLTFDFMKHIWYSFQQGTMVFGGSEIWQKKLEKFCTKTCQFIR